MKVLVVGASGATGKQVVQQLLNRGVFVRILIRATANVKDVICQHGHVETVRGSITEFTEEAMDTLIDGCDAVVSCLGHNISFKGMYGNPRTLVRDAISMIHKAVKRCSGKKIKLILMSTSGYTNFKANEKNSFGEKLVLTALELLLPPHRDNMLAGRYLQNSIGLGDAQVEWVAVRPDSLINEEQASSYVVHASPVRNPIFNAGKTSRNNVGLFMADLLTDEKLWQQWRGEMPVVYNEGQD